MMEPLGYASVVFWLVLGQSSLKNYIYPLFLPARKYHGFPHKMPRRTMVFSPGHPIAPYRTLGEERTYYWLYEPFRLSALCRYTFPCVDL